MIKSVRQITSPACMAGIRSYDGTREEQRPWRRIAPGPRPMRQVCMTGKHNENVISHSVPYAKLARTQWCAALALL